MNRTEFEEFSDKRLALKKELEMTRGHHENLLAETKRLEERMRKIEDYIRGDCSGMSYEDFLKTCMDSVRQNESGRLFLCVDDIRYTFTWGNEWHYEVLGPNALFREVIEQRPPASTTEMRQRFAGQMSESGRFTASYGFF